VNLYVFTTEVARTPNIPANSVNVIQQNFGTNWWTGLFPMFAQGLTHNLKV
jgi:hypothetical protein